MYCRSAAEKKLYPQVQQADYISGHDVVLIFFSHFSVEKGMVFGDVNVHQLKGRIAPKAHSGGAERLDRLQDGKGAYGAADQRQIGMRLGDLYGRVAQVSIGHSTQ